ncbi:MAG: SDR family oxidoreductase [Tenacibaculum sp.]
MKKIIVTGSNGLLGQSLVASLLDERDKYQVFGFSKGKNRSKRIDFRYKEIDLTEKELFTKCLNQVKPDVIVNTAAMTQVDQCEDEKEKCDALNIGVVKSLADYAQKNGTYLVHISTDFIFDGKEGNYKETDIPNPVNYYGISKLKAEQVLSNSNVNCAILRTILVYGQVYNMHRSNIVLWVKKSLEQNKKIKVVNDQYRMPTYVDTLAGACKLSIQKRSSGIFNISSNILLSIYEMALQIAEIFDLNKDLIQPITSKELNQRAKRPEKTGFNLTKSKRELGLEVFSFKEDLQKFKQKIT